MRRLLPLFLLLFLGNVLPAQDLHHSMHYLIPQQYSPAQTASLDGAWRFGGLYRSQWTSVPVSYQSFSGFFDYKAIDQKNFRLVPGVLINYDQAGDAGLRWTQIGLRAAAARQVGDNHFVDIGFGIDFLQRQFDISALTFNSQWDGDLFNSSLSTMENLNAQSKMQPSISAGLGWHWRNPREPRHFGSIGIGSHYINRPSVHFTDDQAWQLPLRNSINGIGSVMLSDLMDFRMMVMFQQMASNTELVGSVGLRYWLEDTALQFNVGYRLGDAVIPAILVQRGSWQLGLAYDVNISDFNIATGYRGGFEIGVTYTALPVPPPRELKVCPIF